MNDAISPLEITGRASIAHLGARKEGKGDNKVLAVDLKLAVVTSNDLLISFHPQLRLMLFTKEGEPRFKEMGGVPWEREFHRMVLELKSDILDKPVSFTPAKVYDFEFIALAGGKVRAMFKAQVKPDQGEFEKIGKLLAEPCDLVLHNLNADLFSAGEGAGAATANPPPLDPAPAPLSTAEPEDEPAPLPEPIGELTDEIRLAMKIAGNVEAAKHEDDRDFEGGMKAAFVALGLKKDFVDEYLAELQSDYTEGWQEVPADV